MFSRSLCASISLRNAKRKAFSLIELLIVVSVIAILVALLLPAVQAARRAASRTQSQSNLRQLYLSAAQFQTSKGYLPPGWAWDVKNTSANGDANRATPYYTQQTWPCWSGLSYCLPFLDQTKSFGALDFSQLPTDISLSGNGTVTSVRLSVFLNPNDSAETDPSLAPQSLVPWTSYRLNGGTMVVDDTTGTFASFDTNNMYNNGPFFGNSHTTSSNIPDGSGYTIAIGESQKGSGSFQSNDTWADGWQGVCYTPILSTDAGTDALVQYVSPLKSFYDQISAQSKRFTMPFWGGGSPNNGVSFVMCDGSIKVISDKVNGQIFRSLTTTNGGKTGVTAVDADSGYIDLQPLPDESQYDRF